MPFKTKYTVEQERQVWLLSSQGLLFKQISAEMDGIPVSSVYRILNKAIKKWGFPVSETSERLNSSLK